LLSNLKLLPKTTFTNFLADVQSSETGLFFSPLAFFFRDSAVHLTLVVPFLLSSLCGFIEEVASTLLDVPSFFRVLGVCGLRWFEFPCHAVCSQAPGRVNGLFCPLPPLRTSRVSEERRFLPVLLSGRLFSASFSVETPRPLPYLAQIPSSSYKDSPVCVPLVHRPKTSLLTLVFLVFSSLLMRTRLQTSLFPVPPSRPFKLTIHPRASLVHQRTFFDAWRN